LIGTTLKHYEIETLLGQGGMGVVYRARDARLGRPVALKVLRAELTSDADRKRRFVQEARAACAVTHPAIAQIYDVDEERGTTFIAMELVEGKSVRALVADRELDLAAAMRIAIQVAQGLGRAHAAGIVHRDIKSDNVMVTRDGHAKILDFGLAKRMGFAERDGSGQDRAELETMAQTQVGTVMGTIAYMSPEQARGRPVDRTSDVFSLGVVIYEMVTGELPFRGDSPLDTLHAIAFEEIRPVTVVRKNLPFELQRIVNRCLRKKPEDRFPDAAALAAELERLEHDLDSGVRRAIPPGERMREALEWLKGSLPIGPAGVAALLLVLAGLGYLIVVRDATGSALALGLGGLFVYRYVRNRKRRLLRRFVARVSRLEDVRAIAIQGDRVTVVVDHAEARIYMRVNGLVETINHKLFHGEPVEVAVRDDLSPEELQRLLREPGVAYVRDEEAASRR